jgi:hypothetical protein
MILRCKNPKCPSRLDPDTETPWFYVPGLAIDQYSNLIEHPRKMDPEEFICGHCEGQVEEVEEDEKHA